ncbi:MAG: hypothetical protein OXG43_12030 [Chloroflexi bacterium]|nr:hypothetical protein [Chloroflexota bacterium]
MDMKDILQFALAGAALFIAFASLVATTWFNRKALQLEMDKVDKESQREVEHKVRQMANDMLAKCVLLNREWAEIEESGRIGYRVLTEEELAPMRDAMFGLDFTRGSLESLIASPGANTHKLANWTKVLLESYSFATGQFEKAGMLHEIKHDPIGIGVMRSDLDDLARSHDVQLLDIGDPSVFAALRQYKREDEGRQSAKAGSDRPSPDE